MMKPLEAHEACTRTKKMTSSRRQPLETNEFDLQVSRDAIVQDASLPRTASHIYTMKKGFYGGSSNRDFSIDTMTKADSSVRGNTARQ